MQHVGLDVHWRQSTICVLDDRGRKTLSRTVKGPWSTVVEELAKNRQPFDLCFEASTGYGYLFDRRQRVARRVVVAHPGQLRLIFRATRKNDRVDAEKLAKLLFLDEVPPVHVPGEDVRAWPRLIEHRRKLVASRTRAKNAVRALLRSHGIQARRGCGSVREWTGFTAFLSPRCGRTAARHPVRTDRVAHANDPPRAESAG